MVPQAQDIALFLSLSYHSYNNHLNLTTMEGSCKCGVLGWIAAILVVVGGLNWGLIAINVEWNVVEMLLGTWPIVARVVYGLVGLSALAMLVKMFTGHNCGGCKTE